MTNTEPLYDIAQKIWDAARKFEYETVQAFNSPSARLPAAYPIITPLVEELVKYVEDHLNPDYLVYADSYIRAMERLQRELLACHDPYTPDMKDPEGIVSLSIKLLTDLLCWKGGFRPVPQERET